MASKHKKPSEIISALKRNVYLIARGRKVATEGKEAIKWQTIGTGFLAGPNKFVTCSHVIDDKKQKNEIAHHQDGDLYFFVKHDDENQIHIHVAPYFVMGQNIFLYPDIDLAILILDDNFYEKDGHRYKNKSEFIHVSQSFHLIGEEVGVLGYPLCELQFQNQDFYKPLLGKILLRTDAGVINCRYQSSPKKYMYEFTIAFNPGNSGGPIFDLHTGKLISIVTGYKSFVIQTIETPITPNMRTGIPIQKYSGESFVDVIRTNYSYGTATPSFAEAFQTHKIS